MTDLSPESRVVLDRFGRQPSVMPSHVAMLYSVVNGSPALAEQFSAAVAAGHLRDFSLLPADTHAGGTYSGSEKSINLPVRLLAPRVGSEAYGAAELTFVLGHEIQHGFNHEATSAAYSRFDEDVRVAANGDHDHTEAISNLISANRRDEASAQLSGWNALVGMVRNANPNATLRDVYDANLRSRDFLTVDDATGDPVVRPQLALSPDRTLGASDANLEGMGQLYFDKQPHQSALGHHGNSVAISRDALETKDRCAACELFLSRYARSVVRSVFKPKSRRIVFTSNSSGLHGRAHHTVADHVITGIRGAKHMRVSDDVGAEH